MISPNKIYNDFASVSTMGIKIPQKLSLALSIDQRAICIHQTALMHSKMFECDAEYETDSYDSESFIDKPCVIDKYDQNNDSSAFRVQFLIVTYRSKSKTITC